jgi:hypothetical protein
MSRMEPPELLGVLPTCAFGRYAASRDVEEIILGNGEHRKVVSGGAHLLAFAGGSCEVAQLTSAGRLPHKKISPNLGTYPLGLLFAGLDSTSLWKWYKLLGACKFRYRPNLQAPLESV